MSTPDWSRQQESRTYLFTPGGQLLLVKNTDGTLRAPLLKEAEAFAGETGHPLHEVLMDSGKTVLTCRLDKEADGGLPAPFQASGLRESYHLLPREEYLEAGKSSQILHWDEMSRFCSRCGTPTVKMDRIMKRCPECGAEFYPPVHTAIIVLIEKGDEILLVRSRNFKRRYFGLVAGFLEAGESLEECLIREVREETGLRVTDIRYFASQPWPYPSGLMAGFTARYLDGELRLQQEELMEAGFFSPGNLPEIPGKMSMARWLIDDWIRRKTAPQEAGRKAQKAGSEASDV